MVTKKKKRSWGGVKLRKAISLKACDYCLDLSKLVFAGVVLATLMGYDADKGVVLLFGSITTLGFGMLGMFCYIISKK